MEAGHGSSGPLRLQRTRVGRPSLFLPTHEACMHSIESAKDLKWQQQATFMKR